MGGHWAWTLAVAISFASGCSRPNPLFGLGELDSDAASATTGAGTGDDAGRGAVEGGESGMTGGGGGTAGGEDSGGSSDDAGADDDANDDEQPTQPNDAGPGDECSVPDAELQVDVTVDGVPTTGTCGSPISVVGPSHIDEVTGELVVNDCGPTCECPADPPEYRFQIEPAELTIDEIGPCSDVLVDYDLDNGGFCELSSIVVRPPDPDLFPWLVAGRALLEPSSFAGLELDLAWIDAPCPCDDCCAGDQPGTYGIVINSDPPETLLEGIPLFTEFLGLGRPIPISFENHLARVDSECEQHVTWSVRPL